MTDCPNLQAAKGYCHLHYNRWRRHGDPLVAHRMVPRDSSVAERLAMLSGQPDANGCRIYTGTIRDGKYGTLTVSNVTKGAHVWAWELANGREVAPGLFVLHSCDVMACVEPTHLREGTHQDNMNDKVERRRCSRMIGVDNPMAKLTRGDAAEIRRLYAEGGWTHATLADRFAVSGSLVGLIIQGKRWIESGKVRA